MFFRNRILYPGWATRDFALIGYPDYGSIMRHKHLTKIGVKSITAKNIFKKYPDIKKQLWGGHFWSDGGYIGTVGDGVTTDIIKRYVETQGTKEEKEG